MKKFDALTPIGILAGLVLLVFAIVTSGGTDGFASFIHLPSILIVFGGITAGLLINFPFSEIKYLFTVMRQAFREEEMDLDALIQRFVELSEKARREGLLALEKDVQEEEDPFLKKGMMLAIDGIEQDMLVDIMNAEITALEERHRKKRSLLEKAGDYAPAWGMIGTLIGLVLMLKNLDDPTSLGPNMAVALLTTLYGSLLANLVFLPMAAKLALKTEKEVFFREIVIEGVVGVQSGQNPKILREKLQAFSDGSERKRAESMTANEAAEL
ncbi:flagellar motor protein MotP [Pseudobacillus badius]|uniref:flagellar motor protein MotP n=1 Tax=Bacillus badius TaxID=1455 RepID=UPI0007B09708|nr:flagellar motor protein MotP [Bacillus badius]KZO01414.1 flagellar motor protein MotP [Bacillus badius]MED0665274.1 flagellar motor protein MotP [Bacillus badius]OCS89750.1 flagellar motor protein MotP [Bacillus badius]OVE51092.1 motility protein A [Bacillus badius]TDW01988.1 chemotaxis protein MotA [Bacillus badius]